MRRYRFGVFCKSGNVGRFAEAMRAALRTAGGCRNRGDRFVSDFEHQKSRSVDLLFLAPQTGLEPVTPSVRNIVVLLAWSASQYSVFFPDKSSLNLPQAALGCVTVNSACSAAQYSVFLPDKSSLHLPPAAFGCVPVNSACCAAHGKRMQEPR